MRKGHGSTKVPNVKLRPAAASSKSKGHASKDPSWKLDYVEGQEEDIEDLKKPTKRPFSGIVICVSGVTDKSTLFSQAERLGATTSANLTDRVTHLITDGPGSPKYIYCVKFNIPIMNSSWITESFDIWLNGGKVDVKLSLEKYRLPVFTSVHLCLTGIESLDRRTRIHKLLTENGGIYVKDLDRNSPITHLLCGGDSNDDVAEKKRMSKKKYVEKLNKFSERETHAVWEEWFWDCLRMKGQLDVKEYLTSNPPPQSKGHLQDELPPASLLQSSSMPQKALSNDVILNTEDAEEVVMVRHAPELTARLWNGLLKKRGFEVKDGKLARSPTKGSAATNRSTLADDVGADAKMPIPAQNGGSLAALQRSKSFLVRDTPTSSFVSSKAQSGKASTTGSIRDSSSRLLSRTASDISIGVTQQSTVSSLLAPAREKQNVSINSSNIFANVKFCLLGEAISPTVVDAIRSRGGSIVDILTAATDYIIVRLSSGNLLYQQEDDITVRMKFRTECWLERCIFDERICAPNEHVVFTPLSIETPIKEASKLVLHFSGFDQSEKCWALRLTRALGINVSEKNFSRKNTHLVCPSRTGLKYDKALEWRIPVVTMDWLFSMARTGSMEATAEFSVSSNGIISFQESFKESREDKIMDITNSGKIPFQQTSRSVFADAVIPVEESGTRKLKNPSGVQVVDNRPVEISEGTHLVSSSTRKPSEDSASTVTQNSPRKNINVSPISSVHVKRLARIPSSESPSPLKAPGTRHHSTLTSETAQALKETIVTLLGKRQTMDSLDTVIEQPQNIKKVKRPARSKPRAMASISSEGFVQSSLLRPPSPSPSRIHYNSDGLNAIQMETDAVDESMRIIYEDPGQMNEKLKLLQLLGDDQSILGKPPEKSTDIEEDSRKKKTGSKSRKDTKRSARNDVI